MLLIFFFIHHPLHISFSQDYSDDTMVESDHHVRHRRLMRQQIHDMDILQKYMKRQIGDLQRVRIGDRLHAIELEQRRLANADFNMSRQVAGLDRLHGSMLELLEDIESLQIKVDHSLPELKKEISKIEFASAQLSAGHSLLREEGHNAAQSIQAIAVSVSTLQEERETVRQLQRHVEQLQEDVGKLRHAADVRKDIVHRHIEKVWAHV